MRLPLAVATVVAGLLATGLPVLPAGAATGATRPSAAPTASARGGVVVRRDARGRAHYLAPRDGRALGRRTSSSPGVAARRQLRRYGSVFGVTDRTLRGTGVQNLVHGRSSVRFQQTERGLPVLGGQLATVVDRTGGLLAVTGETSPRVLSTRYAVAAPAARAAAVRATARDQHLAARTLRVGPAQRWLYDPSLFDEKATAGARASWLVTVTARDRLDVRELVVVDAGTGRVRLHANQVERLDRVVCDNRNVRRNAYLCRPGRYSRTETSAASAVSDVNQAFDNVGATANFYLGLGVDLTALIGSDFGDGKKIRSTVRYCPTSAGCPFQNAFWDGQQMVYGQGFAVADDVIAHELTHGVTQHTSGLVNWFQSGAINESMSDVMGELVDQTDGIGNDDPSVRWVLGEDLSTVGMGPARNMKNPEDFGQPNQVGGPNWATSLEDNGETHLNDGPGDKAAYLIADGTAGERDGTGQFGGFAFPGLGVPTTAALYMTAERLLTPGADYADLANALYASCLTIGVVQASCDLTVRGATSATRMQSLDPAAPAAPGGVVVTGRDGAVRVRWAPAAAGTPVPTSYVLVVTPDVRGVNFLPLEVSPRDQVISGLPPARTFTFGLMAVNSNGNSPLALTTLQGTFLSLHGRKAVRPGQVLHLDGRLRVVANGAGLVNRRVVLRERLAGQKQFRSVARTRTHAGGAYRFRVRVRAQATYLATFASGTNILLGTHSKLHPVRLRRH